MLLVKVVKTIEWLVFIGLCISSIMFSHQVWKQYESYDSSYKISVGNASESPTLIICFSEVQSNMDMAFESQVGKSACIVLAKERHSKGERVPFSAYTPKYTKLKPEAANTLSLMFQIFLEKNYRTPWRTMV